MLQKHSVLDRDCPLLHYQSSLLKKYCEDHFNLEKLKERACTLVSTIKGPVSVSKSVCFQEVLLLNTSQNELTIHWALWKLNELIPGEEYLELYIWILEIMCAIKY